MFMSISRQKIFVEPAIIFVNGKRAQIFGMVFLVLFVCHA
jgi:hypothetical protein